VSDRKQPVPPPAGMKWVAYRSPISGAPYAIGLFPEDADVDNYGRYRAPLGGGGKSMSGAQIVRRGEAEEFFSTERQIRRASKAVLAAIAARDAERSMFDRIRKAFS
jgi:hypothetical protein